MHAQLVFGDIIDGSKWRWDRSQPEVFWTACCCGSNPLQSPVWTYKCDNGNLCPTCYLSVIWPHTLSTVYSCQLMTCWLLTQCHLALSWTLFEKNKKLTIYHQNLKGFRRMTVKECQEGALGSMKAGGGWASVLHYWDVCEHGRDDVLCLEIWEISHHAPESLERLGAMHHSAFPQEQPVGRLGEGREGYKHWSGKPLNMLKVSHSC